MRKNGAWTGLWAPALIGALFLPACEAASRAAMECPPVEIGSEEGNYIVPGVWGGIVYRSGEGWDLRLDAYVQSQGPSRPGILIVHGGGWTAGSRITYVSQFMELFTAAGYNWFSVDYRLAPAHKFPAALEDLRAALEFIRCNASRFRTDADRLVLLGEDAGAHLAALLASERPRGVKALVTLGGIYDLRTLDRFQDTASGSPFAALFGEIERNRALEHASPVLRIVEGMPDALAVHGTEDRDVPVRQAEEYCEGILRAGGRCDLLRVEGGIHAPENWRPSQWSYKRKLLDWLGKTLGFQTAGHIPRNSRLQKNIAFGSYSGPGGVRKDLLMDYWRPEGPGPFPAVIIAHGGGWEAGDKVTYITPLFEVLARAGFAWFSIDYRLTPDFRHPDQLEDIGRAIRYIKQNAARFRIDPGRLALLGESASGQMVARIATEPCGGNAASSDPVDRQSCEVRAVVSFYGVYDFIPMVVDASPRSLLTRLFGPRDLDDAARELLRRYSPIYSVHNRMPPLLLIHGTNERLWSQGLAMEKRLGEVGAEAELFALQGAPHGMENWEGHPEWTTYKVKLVSWLRKTLGS